MFTSYLHIYTAGCVSANEILLEFFFRWHYENSYNLSPKNLSSCALNVSTLLEATASAGIEFQMFTHLTAKDRFFTSFSAQGIRELIGMTSGMSISGVLKYIRMPYVIITVKCFTNLNQVNPQQTSFNGI